jgi:hypothetical protein
VGVYDSATMTESCRGALRFRAPLHAVCCRAGMSHEQVHEQVL